MTTVYLLWLAVASFGVTVPFGGPLVARLTEWRIAKQIRADGPESHEVKRGTPTMGGVLFLIPFVIWLCVLLFSGNADIWPLLLAAVAYGLLGAYDDLSGIRDRTGIGWRAGGKFLAQIGVALLVSVAIYVAFGLDGVYLPGSTIKYHLGAWYVPCAALTIVASANAVNLTDGLDSLAAGTMVPALSAYCIIGSATALGALASSCSVLTGALLAFLWYNSHPARVFMGDTGSLALGAILAVVSLLTEQLLILPVIGIVYVAVTLSDIIQVTYFKYTRRRYGEGRRVFRMAPLQHHFELGGWSEVQVTHRFIIVALAAAACGVALAMGSIV